MPFEDKSKALAPAADPAQPESSDQAKPEENKKKPEQTRSAKRKRDPVDRDRLLPEPDEQVEAELLPDLNKDELDEEGELPEGSKITYKGEDYSLRKYGLFEIEGLRFRATFQQSAEGVTRKIFRAPYPAI